MTAMKITLLLSALFVFLGQAIAAEPFRDDFTQKELKQRRVKTGEWTIGNGVATCAHDDADFKARKNHGFVLAYDVPLQDGTVSFTFTPHGCKQLVFMFDHGGAHLFQLRLGSDKSYVVAYPFVEGTKTQPDKATQKTVSSVMQDGVPNTVTVEAHGSQVTVKIGDQSTTLDYSALAQAKTHLTIGFAHGKMEMKEVSITPATAK
jgi:hypothetical protein